MPDPYMPDVVVEIAFNAGYTTPDASRIWTDVSSYVELADKISITFGRQDERSTADANDLTLTLDNTDGRFTADRSASPYYPNVKIGRPIRVTVTPPGGTASRRFVGFVDEWPVEWDGSDAYARATIRASSRLARLGLSATLRSMIENEIDTPRPSLYWTLGDPAEATFATESSGTLAPRLTSEGAGLPVVFGSATGPDTDGLTAAEFAAGQYLQAAPVVPPINDFSIRATVKLDALPASNAVLAAFVDLLPFGLGVDTAGRIYTPSTFSMSTDSINDGGTHDVVLTFDGTDGRLYLDGALVDSYAAASFSQPTSTFRVGRDMAGTISHVAFYDTVLTAAQVAGMWSSINNPTERTDLRLLRILGWVGVAASEVVAETGVETMLYQETSGQSVVDALRGVESTEGGVLFDGRDGRVTFHNRSRRYLATTAAALNMASQHVGADFDPKLDRSALVNDVTVDNPTTRETARSVDAASVTEYGTATSSAKSVANSYDQLQQKAAWMVASYAEPRTRVPSLTVDVLAHQGLTPSAQTLLGLTVGDLLAVTNAPMQADSTNQSYFIEGYTENIGPQSYSITFNLSPTYPTLNVFVLGDATRGQLDSTYVLAL